jgi:hypothetical protein
MDQPRFGCGIAHLTNYNLFRREARFIPSLDSVDCTIVTRSSVDSDFGNACSSRSLAVIECAFMILGSWQTRPVSNMRDRHPDRSLDHLRRPTLVFRVTWGGFEEPQLTSFESVLSTTTMAVVKGQSERNSR